MHRTHANERTPRPPALGRRRVGGGPGQLAGRRPAHAARRHPHRPARAPSPTARPTATSSSGASRRRAAARGGRAPVRSTPRCSSSRTRAWCARRSATASASTSSPTPGRAEAAERVERVRRHPVGQRRRLRSPSSRGSCGPPSTCWARPSRSPAPATRRRWSGPPPPSGPRARSSTRSWPRTDPGGWPRATGELSAGRRAVRARRCPAASGPRPRRCSHVARRRAGECAEVGRVRSRSRTTEPGSATLTARATRFTRGPK